MTDNQFTEAQLRALENENRQLKENLIDRFAVALAPQVFAEYCMNPSFNLTDRLWKMAVAIVEARKHHVAQ